MANAGEQARADRGPEQEVTFTVLAPAVYMLCVSVRSLLLGERKGRGELASDLLQVMGALEPIVRPGGADQPDTVDVAPPAQKES